MSYKLLEEFRKSIMEAAEAVGIGKSDVCVEGNRYKDNGDVLYHHTNFATVRMTRHFKSYKIAHASHGLPLAAVEGAVEGLPKYIIDMLSTSIDELLLKEVMFRVRHRKGKVTAGDYVMASRWSDIDPFDPWYVGVVHGVNVDTSRKSIVYRVNGRSYNHARCISKEEGELIVRVFPKFEEYNR